jgi:hypothetical protein
MKAALKIILLLLVIAVVAGSMLYYAMTRLEPPMPIDAGNPHANKAWAYVESVGESRNKTTLNQRFFSTRQLVGFLADNHLVDDEEADRMRVALMEHYTPTYANYCLDHLANNSWKDADIKEFAKQMNVAKGVLTSDGKPALNQTSGAAERLEELNLVVATYDSAVVLAKGKIYQSWPNTKRRMARAKRFLNNKYLSGNQQLVEDLDSFRIRVMTAHYDFLERQVERFDNLNLDYTDQATYDSLYHNIKHKLDIFSDSAAYVYGHRPESVGQLKTKLQNNKTNATIYYETVLPAKQAVNDIFDAGKSFIEEIINY